MKPAVDEMFPEGAGPYVDLDEVRLLTSLLAPSVSSHLWKQYPVLPLHFIVVVVVTSTLVTMSTSLTRFSFY